LAAARLGIHDQEWPPGWYRCRQPHHGGHLPQSAWRLQVVRPPVVAARSHHRAGLAGEDQCGVGERADRREVAGDLHEPADRIDGTTRRQYGPSGATRQPHSFASRCAVGSSYTGPTNLVGASNAGSAADTRVWFTTAATCRPGSAFCNACSNQYPIIPWVCAPSTSSGYGWVSVASAALSSASSPTCGPLPWVMTTSCSSASGASACTARNALVRWTAASGRWPRSRRALPPIAMTIRLLTQAPSVATMTALIVCMRFSAWSNTIEYGDAKTSSVTSSASRPVCS